MLTEWPLAGTIQVCGGQTDGDNGTEYHGPGNRHPFAGPARGLQGPWRSFARTLCGWELSDCQLLLALHESGKGFLWHTFIKWICTILHMVIKMHLKRHQLLNPKGEQRTCKCYLLFFFSEYHWIWNSYLQQTNFQCEFFLGRLFDGQFHGIWSRNAQGLRLFLQSISGRDCILCFGILLLWRYECHSLRQISSRITGPNA